MARGVFSTFVARASIAYDVSYNNGSIYDRFCSTFNATSLPSANVTAQGMFCGAKYTHHTFTLIINDKINSTTATETLEVKFHC